MTLRALPFVIGVFASLGGQAQLFVVNQYGYAVGAYTTSGQTIDPALIPVVPGSGTYETITTDGNGHLFLGSGAGIVLNTRPRGRR